VSRILLAWELGANYGHLARLADLAERLRAGGHQLLFAVRDVKSAAEVLGSRGFAFVQAPVSPRRGRASAPPANHAEMLALEGYADEASAWGRVRGWMNLAQLFRADAIVADYAPGALIAGRVLALPQAQLGTGFEIPPCATPMPSIRPWEAVPEDRLLRSERRLTELLNRVLRSLRGRELENLADVYRTEARVLATFPELDPFGPRPGERYVGPMFAQHSGDPAAWPEGGQPRIFAYLRGNVPGAGNLLNALRVAAARTICVIPGIGPATIEKLAAERLRIVARPVQLKSTLREIDLVVMYGGHGLMCAALVAGVPLLVAPHTVEQYLHARQVESAGAGVVVNQDRTMETFSARIALALRDDGLRSNARAFAARHAGFDPERAIAEAAEIVERIASGLAGTTPDDVSRGKGLVR
jgi:UDP:flavonoid glycosyltransferase YjiC (YdhE family)